MNNKNIFEDDINQNTSYWIYTISDNLWKELLVCFNKKKLCIGCYHHANISKGDIVLVFQKNKPAKPKTTGFVGIFICDGKIIDNSKNKDNEDKIKIFNDINLNRYYFKFTKYQIFDEPIRLPFISEKMINATADFVSERKFRDKNLNMPNDLKLLNVRIGSNLVYIIPEAYHILKNPPPKPIEENYSNTNSIPDSDSKKSNNYNSDSSYDTYDSNLDDESSLDSDDFSDADDIFEDSDYNSDNSSDSQENSKIEIDGHIPIGFIPCQRFHRKTNKKDKNIVIKQFKKHYGRCEKCIVINNNNSELWPFLIRGNIIFRRKKVTENLDKIFDRYQKGKIYKFRVNKENIKKPNVYIYQIDDKDFFYYKNLIIVW